MAKTFSTMKTECGTLVMDTSTALATLFETWINDRYRDISKRMDWSALIDDDYTFATVAAQATYDFPTKFDHELFMADITDGAYISRMPEGPWWKERATAFNAGSISSSTQVTRYVILRQASKIKLDPTPTTVHTIAMPYKLLITELSGTTDTVVITDIEQIIIYGAVAEAWLYKRQFAKAEAYLQRYEYELAKRMGQERNTPNQLYQWQPASAENSAMRPLTGWGSYDSI